MNKLLIHREPTDRELKSFKREFMAKKAAQYYDRDTKKEMDSLLRIIGGYQAEIDRLDHVIAVLKRQNETQKIHRYLRTEKNKTILRKFTTDMLNEVLFIELQTGRIYG